MSELDVRLRDHIDGLAPPIGYDEVIVGRGHRPRRRPLLAAAAALVVIVGAVVVVASPDDDDSARLDAGRPTSRAGFRAGGTDAQLVWAEGDGIAIGDPDDGDVRRVRGAPAWCGTCAIVRAGAALFVGGNDGVYRLAPPDFEPVRIADGRVVFPAETAGDLYAASAVRGDATVTRITPEGEVVGGPSTVPTGFALSDPPRAVRGGLLVKFPASDSRFDLRVWNPTTGEIVDAVQGATRLIDTYVDGDSTKVAYVPAECEPEREGFCDLVVVDLATGVTTNIAPVAGELGFLGGGGFSPDGTQLAGFAALDGSMIGGDAGGRRMRLIVVDVDNGEAVRVRGVTAEFGENYGFATWSPSGRWVFFGGINRSTTGAHRVGTPDAVEVDLPPNYSMVAMSDSDAVRRASTTTTEATLQDERSYPLWPERTPAGARQSAANGDDAWRRDAGATAVEFARQVLGWRNAQSAGPTSVSSGAAVRVTNGASTVDVYLNQWAPQWWSVAVVDTNGESIGVKVEGRDVMVAFGDEGHVRGTATVHYGDRSQTAQVAAGQGVAELQLPFDPDVPGTVLILLRDRTGAVFHAKSASFPAGDFAAG